MLREIVRSYSDTELYRALEHELTCKDQAFSTPKRNSSTLTQSIAFGVDSLLQDIMNKRCALELHILQNSCSRITFVLWNSKGRVSHIIEIFKRQTTPLNFGKLRNRCSDTDSDDCIHIKLGLFLLDHIDVCFNILL